MCCFFLGGGFGVGLVLWVAVILLLVRCFVINS